jgi:hypothetical protein
MIQEIGFALDSPLEGAGFEPSVPGRDNIFRRPPRKPATTNRPDS